MTSNVPRKIEGRTTSISFGLVTELTVADETVNLILEKIQDRNATVYRGGMIAGQRLLVVALLEELIPELEAPESIRNLAITQLAVEMKPEKGAFAFDAAIENAWSITLDSGPTISIDRLALSVLSIKPPQPQETSPNQLAQQRANALSQQRKVAFEGLFQLFGGEFSVNVVHQFSSFQPQGQPNPIVASQWQFSAIAENISITEIIKAFGFSQDQLNKFGLSDLRVSLAFALDQKRYKEGTAPHIRQITESVYTFKGKLLWDTGIELVPNEETLKIEAAIDIFKASSTRPGSQQSVLRGQIGGTVQASIPFFETLKLSVVYAFSRTSQTSQAQIPQGSRSQPLARRTGELIFHLQVSSLLLSAVYTSTPDPRFPNDSTKNRKILRFSVSLVDGKNPTVGDLIAYVVSLYDPSIPDFELDPPWDEFAKQEIGLDRFSLEVDLTQKTLTISYKETFDVLIARVSNIGLSYQFGTDPSRATQQRQQARTASNKKVAIAVNLSIPGQPEKRVQWDPVNQNPPAVPGSKAPIFDLQFLALGQRVAFAPEIIQQTRTIEQFTDVMRQSLVPLPPIKRRQNPLAGLQQSLPSAVSSDPTKPVVFSGQPIRFNAESSWLIGAQFSILGSIDLSVIFNDPFIYGLRISLSGQLVQSFSGFEFEILYRRISDTVGVYRAELTLPDSMRKLQFGKVDVTLPVVAVEIYTNGDFGIDVGFPWNEDFSRSIAVTILVFMGVGGFYFNKLSAETATSVPEVVDGTFNPVLEFGLGLKVGIGKILKKGPLSAEVSITIQGLLQGVYATFNPIDTSRDKKTYFRIQGGVAIVGRIYGVVDLKILQVDIEVIAKIAVLFVVEVYKAIHVALVAEVSVKASVKVGFIKVSRKFSLKVREEFILGSDSTPPWQIALPTGSAMAADIPVFSASTNPAPVAFPPSRRRPPRHRTAKNHSPITRTARFAPTDWSAPLSSINGEANGITGSLAGPSKAPLLLWEPDGTAIKLPKPKQIRDESWKDDKFRLDIYFQVAITKDHSAIKGVGLLFIENSIPLDSSSKVDDNDTDFDELVKALFKWVIAAYLYSSELLPNDGALQNESIDNQSLTLEILEDIYTLFSQYLDQSPIDEFGDILSRFLTSNFVFEISEHSPEGKDELSGTLFPMFPQLQMKLEKVPAETIQFDQPKYSLDEINKIRRYFRRQTGVKHDPITDESVTTVFSEDMSTNEELSVAELLFADYFALIIRSVLQQGIDYIRDKGQDVDGDGQIQLIQLLDNLNGGEPFESLAGMTSGFLLNGLRLSPTDNRETIPIYAATGQQFDITVTSVDEDDISFTPNQIQLAQSIHLTSEYIRFTDAPNDVNNTNFSRTLDHSLIASEKDRSPLIRNLHQLDNEIEDEEKIISLEEAGILWFYDAVSRQFAIRKKVFYREGASNKLLLEVSKDLQSYLRTKPGDATIALKSNSSNNLTEPGQPITPEVISNYAWATKLKLNVGRIDSATTLDPLPTTYKILSLDETDRTLLRYILEDEATPSQIRLFYLEENNSSKQLMGHENAIISILKTNLSLQSNELPGTTVATFEEPKSFLRLLAEGSTLDGEGYYLTYAYQDGGNQKGFPEAIFADEKTATITLLLEFGSPQQPNRYHNCIINIKNDGTVEAGVFAESSEMTQVLRVPAGNLGFRLIRDSVEPADNDSAIDAIQNLYQLLSYQIPEASNINSETAQDWLPIGPVEQEDNSDQWVYEKVIPVHNLFKAEDQLTGLPGQLVKAFNPYAAIGQQFQLTFRWQDVYGNRLGQRGELKQAINLELGYFDPLLSINQWPSVEESYTITPLSEDKANLTLELALEQTKYIPKPNQPFEESLDQIKTDRILYQKIYYQVHDANVTFKAKTSVIPDWSHSLTRQQRAAFTDFVDSAYRYLATLEYLQPKAYELEAEKSLTDIANEYNVDIRDIANLNAERSGLFADQNIRIPVGFRVYLQDDSQPGTESGSSLQAIAGRLSSEREGKIQEIVKTYAQTFDLLTAGVQIPETDGIQPYTIQSGDTFESIAIAQLAMAEDRLINGHLQAIARSSQVQQALAEGVFIKGLSSSNTNYYVTLNPTLEAIAYEVLRLENADLNDDFEQRLTERINTIATDAIRQEILRDIAQAIRNSPIFPDGTELSLTVANQADSIKVKVITEKSWRAIAGAFPRGTETIENIVLANADRQDLLLTGQNILEDAYTIRDYDSLRHIATNQFIIQDSRPSILRDDIDILAEVGALEYEIIPPDGSDLTLATLTQQLHLQTEQHRTVLETVRDIGNMGQLLSKSILEEKLAELAVAVKDISGLFGGGDKDLILADVVLDITTAGRSFEQMIVDAGEDSQILTGQITAGDIAVRNRELKVQADQTILLPDHFTLGNIPDSIAYDDLAVFESSNETPSLATLAANMGTGISAAAVAIANQNMTGLLSSSASIEVTRFLTQLIGFSLEDPESLDLDDSNENKTLQVLSTDTLHSLKNKLEKRLVSFKEFIESEAQNAQQKIGALNAIYEQLTFEGANFTALSAVLNLEPTTSLLGQLKDTLLDGDNLKPQFRPLNAYSQLEEPNIQQAISNIDAANRQANKADLIDALKDSLSTIHLMYDRSYLKAALDSLEKRSQRPLTVAEVGTALKDINLVAPETQWIVPPAVATTTLEIPIRNNSQLSYPKDLLFSVNVQVEMQRKQDLMHSDGETDHSALPEDTKAVSAYFAPKTVALTASDIEQSEAEANSKFQDRIASLTPFAEAFEQALPGLKLAVGRNSANIDNANPQNSDALWAVHLGKTGIHYNIHEDFPYFFSMAPLSNTLMSGEVSLYQYNSETGLNTESAETMRADAVDLNSLARIYLQAIEDVLSPEVAVPAANGQTLKPKIEALLKIKAQLAEIISQQVTHVVEITPESNKAEYNRRKELAVATLRKELLTNLANAYDIETIVQYNVDVTAADGYNWKNQTFAPRLSGQPTIIGAYYTDSNNTPNVDSSDTAKKALLQSLDFALSPAKVTLDAQNNSGKSTLSFFFNTETPQRYEDIAVQLMYQVNELEYDINTENSTSSWLNFVVPLNQPDSLSGPEDPNYIGNVQIPIPLRDYPVPPSLIAHKAVPDPDGFSGETLNSENIRDWNYVFLYEHPDIAQDTVECRIDYNSTSLTSQPKLAVDDAVAREGETLIFTVRLFPPSEKEVTVNYKTQDVTATAGRDYTGIENETLTFAPGETTKTVAIEILNDEEVENIESFRLILSDPDGAEIVDSEGLGFIVDAPLLDTLVRFKHLYPSIANDLRLIESGDVEGKAENALNAFVKLADDVAQAWQRWQSLSLRNESMAHYTIDENLTEPTKTVEIKPIQGLNPADQQILKIRLPGYELDEIRLNGTEPPELENNWPKNYEKIEFDFSPNSDNSEIETFGESALPDREVTVINLDVLDYQSAWGSIRLSRNQNLIDGKQTNPAFIFRTPEVRFKDRLTPLIINDRRWDIGALDDSNRNVPLAEHLRRLFEVLLPPEVKRPYDLIIACQYAFAITTQGLPGEDSEPLLATLPVLLTPRFTVRKPDSVGQDDEMLSATDQLRRNIVETLQRWWQENQEPNSTRGRFVFSVSLLSNPAEHSSVENPNLPLLAVENLELKLEDVRDRADWIHLSLTSSS